MTLRMVRLLTLACFFHFSGLNNGITCMVAGSGKIQSGGFAPVAIQSVASIVNPAHWGAVVSARDWMKFLNRSSRVIEISSQKAIRSIFLESNLFQVWAGRALNVPSQSAQVAPWTNHGDSFRTSVSRPAPLSASVGQRVRFEGSPDYLSLNAGESWLKMEKLDIWSGGRDPVLSKSQGIAHVSAVKAGLFESAASLEKLRQWLKSVGSEVRPQVTVALKTGGSSDDDAAVSLNRSRS